MMEMNQGYPAVAALKMAQIQKRQAERHNYADLALSAIKLERRAIERSKRPLYDTTSWGRFVIFLPSESARTAKIATGERNND
jgi:hypothetical protein